MQAPPPTLPTSWLNSLTQSRDDNNSVRNLLAHDPSTLITSSTPLTFTLGTGSSIYRTLTPLLSQTNHELLLVTCFWAPCPSLAHLSQLLLHLSTKSLSRPPHTPRIRVRICLSSLSLVQKLFHTPSLTGHVYEPSTWVSKFGLPPPEDLRGLDLQIKSIFVWPFSVMHPKFVVVDRRRVWVPSCNVSWEAWFEGCVELEGPVVRKLVDFWRDFWGRDEEFPALPPDPPTAFEISDAGRPATTTADGGIDTLPRTITFLPTTEDIRTIFLPSPHTRNPHFRPLPWQSPPAAPSTPLNAFLLHAFSTATKSIYIQTPNLTSPPVLTALLAVLDRGVDVHVVTNRRMMLLEQLFTAGTVTELCVWWLVRSYRRLLRHAKARGGEGDEETGRKGLGRLSVEYYRPVSFADRGGEMGEEPVKSHLKMTVVDGVVLVLGSGNMDRASWFTSQELGVAFLSEEMAGTVLGMVRGYLVRRVEEYYSSP